MWARTGCKPLLCVVLVVSLMEGVITLFFLRPGTLWCVHSMVAGLTLSNCWGWASDLWASLPNSPLPFCSTNISTATATRSTSCWDCWLRLQKCLFLGSESCHGCYFPSATWKSNAKADLRKGEPRAPSGCCGGHRCCFLCSSSRANFQVLPWACVRLQHTVSIRYYACPFHIQIYFISSVTEDLFLHYQWHILIIHDEEWTQWTAFPLFS